MKRIPRLPKSLFLCIGLAALLISSWTQAASHWNRFRGPNGTGRADSSIKLSQLKSSDAVWKIDLPGEGHSSPILWEDTLFLTSMHPDTSRFHVLAVDTSSGNVRWTRDVDYQTFRKHDFNSFASPSATVDAERVYISWVTPDHYMVAALDHAGEWLWKEDLGTFKSQHGGGVSPVIYRDKLIVANDQMGPSFLTALDKSSGSRVWTTQRKSGKTAYSTPCVYVDAHGKEQLIFNSEADGISGVDPENGHVLWSYANAFDKRSCSSPMVAAGKVFGSCGSGGGGNFIVAVNPPEAPQSQEAKLAFEIRRSANYVPSPIAVGDLAFFWSDSGFLTCADPATGKVFYQERVRQRYFGSPVAVGNEIACLSTTGELVVAAASKQFQVLNRVDLDETTHSTPAFDRKAMYIRTLTHLYKFQN